MMKAVKVAKARTQGKRWWFYFLMMALGFMAGRYFSIAPPVYAAELKEESFSEIALLLFMKDLGIKYPETVLSQARLETGNFSSAVFRENHNLFGMKVAKKRPTTAIGVNRGHAVYRNWKDSVIDYALFQSYAVSKLPKDDRSQYRKYLQEFYSETADYLTRLDRMLEGEKTLAFVRQNY